MSGPAGGGTAASVYGLNFADGSTVSIGGAAATGVSLASPTQIDATTPALSPGSVNDVVVTVPGSPPVNLPGAWFAQFLDVPPSYLFARPIEKLRRMGITTGCGGGNYCPGDSVTRAQMAVFILRGKHGSAYHPPPATGTVFNDVPKTALFADWMEEFAAEGITTGCGNNNYCPNNSVTRGEMAVFLLRAKLGSAHNPPPPTGVFGDVPVGAPFAKWIEELAGRSITSGCGGGDYCPTLPSTRGQMAVFLTKTFGTNPPDLIADDLANGVIDYETSLLYRFYALFTDQRLPARYQNAPSDGEDSGLFEEVQDVLSSLSPAGQAALAPFLARPDDPSSPFGPAAAPVVQRPDDGSQNQCQTQWIDAPATHFVVHLCATGNDANDQLLLTDIGSLADGLWDAMTKAPPGGMGEPLADCFTPQGGSEICPGGDGKIDVYILDTNQCWQAPAPIPGCFSVPGGAVAAAAPAPPIVNKATSGFILLARSRASDPEKIKSDFAHEFFHVLQFAHNRLGAYADTGIRINGEAVFKKCWFVESSATWAEWEYVPATAPVEVHPRFVNSFEPSHDSLLTALPKSHMYASYIWSFFSEQEKGSGSPTFQAWVAAEGAADADGITNAVDAQLPFETHFRDFAVRNWNIDLPGHPIPTLYKDLKASDGSSPPFPLANPPFVHDFEVPLTSGSPVKVQVALLSLSAEYDEVTFDPTVRKIVLHFDKLPASIDVDLLVEIAGTTWNLVHADKSQPTVYCRDQDSENVSRIIVITSNHDKTPDDFASGDYEIEGKPSCCGELANVSAFKAHVTANYSFSGQANVGYEQDFQTSQSFDISGELGVGYGNPGFFSLNDNPTGTGSEHDKVVSHVGSSTLTSTQDGDGNIDLSSSVTLTVDLAQCTFTFFTAAALQVSNGQPGTFIATIGTIHAGGTHSLKDFTDKITGGMSFPAHSYDWWSANTDKDSYEVGGLGSTWFFAPNSEDNAGSAQITWEFDPDPPLAPAAATSAKKKGRRAQ